MNINKILSKPQSIMVNTNYNHFLFHDHEYIKNTTTRAILT